MTLSQDPQSPARGVGWRLGGLALRLVRAAAVAFLIVVLGFMLFEESLIFFPDPYPSGDWQPRGLTFEDAWFDSADGVHLHGWYVPCDRPRAVLLFAHGNAGNLSHRVDRLQDLHRMGVAALMFDYRGYGRSQGKPTEAGVLADARAARAWLANRAGIAENQIVLMGESVGGGVMVDLAAKDGARGLIVESTFTSLADVAAYHYPLLPVRMFMRTRMDSLGKIASYRGPLLACHGDADRIVPFTMGQRLFDAANEPKRFVRLPGHDHNDPMPPVWQREIDAFIGGLP